MSSASLLASYGFYIESDKPDFYDNNFTRTKFTGIKDIDLLILQWLEYEDIRSFCQIIQFEKYWNNNDFWRTKLLIDFPLRSKYLYSRKHIDLKMNNPRKLYKIINKRSNLINFKQIIYDYYINIEYDYDDGAEFIENDIRILEHFVLNNDIEILRGDVITIDLENCDRNEGKLIWTGKNFVNLNYDIDEYGSLSREFTFPEFPISHFYDSIEHNCIGFLSEQTIKEAINTFDEKTRMATISDRYNTYKIYPKGDREHDDSTTKILTKEQFADFIQLGPYLDPNDQEDDPGIFALYNSYYHFYNRNINSF